MHNSKSLDLIHRHVLLQLHDLQNAVAQVTAFQGTVQQQGLIVQDFELQLENHIIPHRGPGPSFLQHFRHLDARPLQGVGLARSGKVHSGTISGRVSCL